MTGDFGERGAGVPGDAYHGGTAFIRYVGYIHYLQRASALRDRHENILFGKLRGHHRLKVCVGRVFEIETYPHEFVEGILRGVSRRADTHQQHGSGREHGVDALPEGLLGDEFASVAYHVHISLSYIVFQFTQAFRIGDSPDLVSRGAFRHGHGDLEGMETRESRLLAESDDRPFADLEGVGEFGERHVYDLLGIFQNERGYPGFGFGE